MAQNKVKEIRLAADLQTDSSFIINIEKYLDIEKMITNCHSLKKEILYLILQLFH